MSSRRAAAAVLGALVLGVAGCGGGAPSPEGEPAPTSPAETTGTGIDESALEEFLGNGLQMAEDGNFGLDISQLIEDPSVPGGTLLRTFYPEGSASRGTDGPDGGMQAYMELPEPADVIDLTYQVRFPEGFEFVKGGKLPGLYGGTENSGGDIPDGTNGLSTRYMWRTDGEGEVYAYLPSSEEHGTSLGRGCWTFTPGSWTTMRQRVQLNSPDADDGRISVWQDGRLVLDRGGLQFRTTDELQIDGVFFSTFFGGGDQSWASPVDQHVDFAAFEVAEGSAPPPGPAPESEDDGDCGVPGAP